MFTFKVKWLFTFKVKWLFTFKVKWLFIFKAPLSSAKSSQYECTKVEA